MCTFLFLSVYHVWFFDHFSSIPYWDARRTSSSLMITRFHIRMKLIVLTAKQMVPQYGQWDMRWLTKFENHWYWLTETLTFSNFLRVINLTPPSLFHLLGHYEARLVGGVSTEKRVCILCCLRWDCHRYNRTKMKCIYYQQLSWCNILVCEGLAFMKMIPTFCALARGASTL